nr:MAG TPA: hypothetical protein [Caudoviricetes sp.]
MSKNQELLLHQISILLYVYVLLFFYQVRGDIKASLSIRLKFLHYFCYPAFSLILFPCKTI